MKVLRLLWGILAILITICSLGYLLPTGIAMLRIRTNTAAIFVLNLLLGWTVVGWVIALVWSVANDERI